MEGDFECIALLDTEYPTQCPLLVYCICCQML